ncbi:outer membrane lipoprotein chaperone LolA [Candidatus Enterovibrio altilux]|nr:outer membrane lipoprotein chaperone LolA [Candidatus Enterovibrio luxaltus]
MRQMLLSLLLCAPVVLASPKQELSTRLDKLNSFTAVFKQMVTSPEGEVISESEGTLAMKRPNLFHWKTIIPDENLLVFDGETLWYYSPVIEQVTAMRLDDMISKTPFSLLIRNDSRNWQNYNVSHEGDKFVLSPNKASNMVTLIITVLPNGCIMKFSIVEQDGQISRFAMSNIKNVSPKASLFRFTVPNGVELDDQR